MKKYDEQTRRISTAWKRHLKKYKRLHRHLPAYCVVPYFEQHIAPAPKRKNGRM